MSKHVERELPITVTMKTSGKTVITEDIRKTTTYKSLSDALSGEKRRENSTIAKACPSILAGAVALGYSADSLSRRAYAELALEAGVLIFSSKDAIRHIISNKKNLERIRTVEEKIDSCAAGKSINPADTEAGFPEPTIPPHS